MRASTSLTATPICFPPARRKWRIKLNMEREQLENVQAKNLDNHNRWRNKTVAFRVSPEEDISSWKPSVKLTGLTKQDYIIRRLLGTGCGGPGQPQGL